MLYSCPKARLPKHVNGLHAFVVRENNRRKGIKLVLLQLPLQKANLGKLVSSNFQMESLQASKGEGHAPYAMIMTVLALSFSFYFIFCFLQSLLRI